MKDLEQRIAELEAALAKEHARNNAHLLMIAAILRGIHAANAGAYEAARRCVMDDYRKMDRAEAHEPLQRELRSLIDSLPPLAGAAFARQALEFPPAPPAPTVTASE